MTFNISIPLYNVEKTIKKTITSIQNQTESNFNCILINDCSTDKSEEIIKSLIKYDNRFKLINNQINTKNALENNVIGFNQLNPNDNSICIMIDGDDWLIDNTVLKYLKEIYKEKKPNVTHGCYITYPNNQKSYGRELPEWIKKNNLYRCVYPFFLTHLKTFNGTLWKKLNQDHLKHNNKFIAPCCDVAIMLSLLELAEEKVTFIEKPLYVYNRSTMQNVDINRSNEQYEMMKIIRSKKTSCINKKTENERWKSITKKQIDELLAIEQTAMKSIELIGNSFIDEPFNIRKHSEIYKKKITI